MEWGDKSETNNAVSRWEILKVRGMYIFFIVAGLVMAGAAGFEWD